MSTDELARLILETWAESHRWCEEDTSIEFRWFGGYWQVSVCDVAGGRQLFPENGTPEITGQTMHNALLDLAQRLSDFLRVPREKLNELHKVST